jgi:hypothetical protein
VLVVSAGGIVEETRWPGNEVTPTLKATTENILPNMMNVFIDLQHVLKYLQILELL